MYISFIMNKAEHLSMCFQGIVFISFSVNILFIFFAHSSLVAISLNDLVG